MCKSEPVCYRGYLVGLLFRKISMKREEQNNCHAYAANSTRFFLNCPSFVLLKNDTVFMLYAVSEYADSCH